MGVLKALSKVVALDPFNEFTKEYSREHSNKMILQKLGVMGLNKSEKEIFVQKVQEYFNETHKSGTVKVKGGNLEEKFTSANNFVKRLKGPQRDKFNAHFMGYTVKEVEQARQDLLEKIGDAPDVVDSMKRQNSIAASLEVQQPGKNEKMNKAKPEVERPRHPGPN